MRLSGDNYEQVLRLFSDYKRGRINEVNARIEGERAINPGVVGNLWTPGPNDTSLIGLSSDDVASRLNPNHIRGMVTYHGQTRENRIIDLPSHIDEGLRTHVREEFARHFNGMVSGHGNRTGLLMQSFVREIPENDRLNANWTMHQIMRDEHARIESAIREAMPNWQRGWRVPDEILRPILNGHGGNFNATV